MHLYTSDESFYSRKLTDIKPKFTLLMTMNTPPTLKPSEGSGPDWSRLVGARFVVFKFPDEEYEDFPNHPPSKNSSEPWPEVSKGSDPSE